MSDTDYQKMRYKNKMYAVGDGAQLKEAGNVHSGGSKLVVGKILRIMPFGGNPEYPEWPTIEVQWYYFGSELDLLTMGIKQGDLIYIGDNELFYSDHTDVVFVESIINKCEVLTIDEYDSCDMTDDSTYYGRSFFKTKENTLEPPFEEWKTLCSGNKPMNPNLLTVGCDKGSKWFHPHCQGLENDQIADLDYFVCTICKNAGH